MLIIFVSMINIEAIKPFLLTLYKIWFLDVISPLATLTPLMISSSYLALNIICTPNSQTYIQTPDRSSELQTHISSCIFESSTQKSNTFHLYLVCISYLSCLHQTSDILSQNSFHSSPFHCNQQLHPPSCSGQNLGFILDPLFLSCLTSNSSEYLVNFTFHIAQNLTSHCLHCNCVNPRHHHFSPGLLSSLPTGPLPQAHSLQPSRDTAFMVIK